MKANLTGVVPFQYCVRQPRLHSKWLLLLKLEISLVVNFCFITNQRNSNFNCSYMAMSSLTLILGFSVRFFQPDEIKITSKSFAQKFELK